MNRTASHTAPRPSRDVASLRYSIATGICFVYFWALSLAGTLVVLPVLLTLPGDRKMRARRLVGLGFRLLTGMIEVLGIFRFRIEGGEWLRAARGRLIVANHPCFLDVVVLLACLPEANCVMKASLRRHPLFAAFVRACGYISNAADPLETLAACRAAQRCGETLIIFPEGSRTPAGAAPKLHRGAAHIALRAGMDILPVVICCNPPALTHGRPWYAMPPGRVEYVLSLHAPRSPQGFVDTRGLSRSHAARRLTRALQAWFEERMEPEGMP